MTFSLPAYLARIRLPSTPPPSLSALVAAHARSITFENLDVVLRRPIDVAPASLQSKLLGTRGGYCFEQNTLLALALRALDYSVAPLLCRVRWGKAADDKTAFTHMALRVVPPGDNVSAFLIDVGFAGSNSIAPIALDGTEQLLPEGRFRVVDGVGPVGEPGGSYSALQLLVKESWRDMYVWRTGEVASDADLAVANWWSCTPPSARFCGQFFCARVIGDERVHVLNDNYVRRSMTGEVLEERVVADVSSMSTLLRDVFGLEGDAVNTAVDEWAAKYKRQP